MHTHQEYAQCKLMRNRGVFMRPKLTINAQIEDMKDAGITFGIISESDARQYIENNTYYFRIKAYAKNYDKYIGTAKAGQYINLDFAYLKDLSIIDAYLRRIILRMTLDIEHFLKVKMLSDFQKVDEDGYEIVQELFKMQPELQEKLEGKDNSSTCNEIVEKYRNDWAIWNIAEVMSFGQFSELYALFYNRNDFKDSYANLILPIKMIRNASAHNNCLINRLRPPYTRNVTPRYDIRNELYQQVKISHKAADKKLAHPAIHDFIVLLYLYSRIVPSSTKMYAYSELNDLFNSRMPRHSDYYVKNDILKSSYRFTADVVNYYCNHN